ncbi:calcium-binding protein CBP-like [Silene latifolia]|uniref:calcium-binding protein CBP-like n=1 Tax=Silene latifolia TaxID=37657 RepID=UPI003D781E04
MQAYPCETQPACGTYQGQQPQMQSAYGTNQGQQPQMQQGGSYGYSSSSSYQGQQPQVQQGSSYGYSSGASYQGQQPLVQQSGSYNKYSSSSSTMTVFGQDAFCDVMPSSFPPGTDPKMVECFNRIDRNGNGLVDDKELQSVLSSCNQTFSQRTVHLLMYQFTHSNKRMLGPKEFVPLLNNLKSWQAVFQKFDRDRNGRIDSLELGTALNCLGYSVSPCIVNMLVSKFGNAGARCSLQYDHFIECCLTVKGLSETFKAKAGGCNSATFCYDEFLINVLPFIIA